MKLIDLVIGGVAVLIVVLTLLNHFKKQRKAKQEGRSAGCSACDVSSCSVASCCTQPQKKT